MNPKILILDEPTAGLDPQGRDDILDQIAALHKMRGITIILVSHSMEDIAKYVERLIVMNHGEMVFDDTPKNVFSHYKELADHLYHACAFRKWSECGYHSYHCGGSQGYDSGSFKEAEAFTS